MDKEETILYLRHLKSEGYIFSNFNLNHVLDFIDELQEERKHLLKQLEKEQSIRKEAIEYMKKCLNDVYKYGSNKDIEIMKKFYDYPLSILERK